MKRTLRTCLAVIVVGLPWLPAAWGDVFVLSQGGRVVGDLQNPEQSPRQTYVVKTAEGSTVTLGRAQVKQVVRQRPEEIEYEKLRVSTPETAEAQWDLSEWCRGNKLPVQRKAHLQRVIALDPEHAEARRALGYQRVNGKWATRDELMLKAGYQRYQGGWKLPEEIAILEEKRDATAHEKEWTRKIDAWLGWLGGPKDAEAREGLRKVDDPVAVRGLAAALSRSESPEVRGLLVAALAHLGTPQARRVLAGCSLEDEVEEVRMICVDFLKKTPDAGIVDFYVDRLRNRNNAIVNRAAYGLKEMGDPAAIGPLIDALITVHKSRAPSKPPGQMSATFGSGGGGGGIGMSAGGGGPKYITYPVKNQMVLDALVALSGANFGFDVPAWKAWYLAQKKRDSAAARRTGT